MIVDDNASVLLYNDNALLFRQNSPKEAVFSVNAGEG